MNIFQFMSESPFLTFFLFYMVYLTINTAVRAWVRSRNIKHHGWPPPHCDAEGDFKPGTGGRRKLMFTILERQSY
jgi:hypothetical protein